MNTTDNNSLASVNNFVLIVVLVALAVFLVRAFLGYRNFKYSIFRQLYNDYLIDYFYHLNVFRDVSRSGKLKKELGVHRIVYSNMANKEGRVVTQFVNIIHSKGITSIAYLNPYGKLTGKDNGSWVIHRVEEGEEKKYKIDNPVQHLREYEQRIRSLTERSVDKYVAVEDGSDITGVVSSIPCIPYSKVIDVLKQSDCGYGLNDAEIDEIYEKLGGKIDKK